MEKRVVNQKLENLRIHITRVESKVPPSSDVLTSDFDVQDIISINLERAIQSAIDIAAHIGADFDDATAFSAASVFFDLAKHTVITDDVAESLARAAGFRNLLVHRYTSIDWQRVYSFITTKLDVFRHFVDQIEKCAE